MKQAILLSVQPKWLSKILNGEKTIEVRKTMPKCELPIDVYIYCTKGKPFLDKETFLTCKSPNFDSNLDLNGKVVAKFRMSNMWGWFYPHEIRTKQELQQEILERSCMTLEEIEDYAENENIFFAWCIDDLEIFDKPMELDEFYKVDKKWEKHYKMWNRIDAEELARFKISRAPQSWQYVYVEKSQ